MYLLMCERRENGSAEYAFCTCGTRFQLPKNPDPNARYCGPEVRYDTSHTCPHCGAQYGGKVLRVSVNGPGIWGTCIGDGDILYGIEADGDTVSLVKEELPNAWVGMVKESKPIPVRRSVITFDVSRGLHLVKLEVDGREVNLTQTNLGRAASKLSARRFKKEPATERFLEELSWFQETCMSPSSLAAPLKMFLKYPVLDSLYEWAKRADRLKPAYFFARAVEGGAVEEGERSIRKAIGLSMPLLEHLFAGRISFVTAKRVIRQYGKEVGQEAIRLACEITPSSRVVGDLSLFLAGRNPAERRRLKAYLTEEVCIYQGIEDPAAAWRLLADYISMSKEMGVEYELCPKSLKLRHDLAARNLKLVLQEEERRKFTEKVSEPGYAGLTWTSRNGQWAVIVPTEAGDLVREGAELSHCVGSYVSYIVNGSKKICFLRRTGHIEKPLLTLTVNNEGHCSTYLGFDNREATQEERAALREWTKARHLILDE